MIENNVDKIESFRQSVMKEAEEIITRKIEDATQKREELFKSESERIEVKSYERISESTKRIRSNADKRVSSASFEAKRAILRRRGELVDEFFGGIAAKLVEFVHGDAYGDFVAKNLAQANTDLPFYEGVRVSVAENDTSAAQVVQKQFPALTVTHDPKIKLGGLILYYPNEQKIVDETLDKRLANEKKAFVSISELQL